MSSAFKEYIIPLLPMRSSAQEELLFMALRKKDQRSTKSKGPCLSPKMLLGLITWPLGFSCQRHVVKLSKYPSPVAVWQLSQYMFILAKQAYQITKVRVLINQKGRQDTINGMSSSWLPINQTILKVYVHSTAHRQGARLSACINLL